MSTDAERAAISRSARGHNSAKDTAYDREKGMQMTPDNKGFVSDIGSESWLRERFPDKDWHRHPRTDGRTDLCDGTPSDCAAKVRL